MSIGPFQDRSGSQWEWSRMIDGTGHLQPVCGQSGVREIDIDPLAMEVGHRQIATCERAIPPLQTGEISLCRLLACRPHIQEQGLAGFEGGQIRAREIDVFDTGSVEPSAGEVGPAQAEGLRSRGPADRPVLQVRTSEIDVGGLRRGEVFLDRRQPVAERHDRSALARTTENGVERLQVGRRALPGEYLAEEVERFGRGHRQIPARGRPFPECPCQVACEKELLEGGMSEPEVLFLGVRPEDEGGSAEVFLEDIAIPGEVGTG